MNKEDLQQPRLPEGQCCCICEKPLNVVQGYWCWTKAQKWYCLPCWVK